MSDAEGKPSPAAPRLLVTHGCRKGGYHPDITHTNLAQHLAAILQYDFAGAFEDLPLQGTLYHFPRATLVGREIASRFKLAGEEDLFGGWVSHEHMATKAVVHPLVSSKAAAPEGWADALAENAGGITLRGFSVFSPQDAVAAAQALLPQGPVRFKPIHADGARGQMVARTQAAIEEVVEQFSTWGRLKDALVVEESLAEPVTYSVGQIRVAGQLLSYCGTQSLTTDNNGSSVYGGSALTITRGGYENLDNLPLPDDMRQAIACGRDFDALADKYLPGLIASRRNYDVVRGLTHEGSIRFGVLEQSWRAGGATGAELAALEILAREPATRTVLARTVERYGPDEAPPAGAAVYFHGIDPEAGAMTKYVTVEKLNDAGRAHTDSRR